MSILVRRSLPMAFLGAFALAAVAGLPVHAQQDNQGQQDTQQNNQGQQDMQQQDTQQTPPANINDEQLRSFAEASLQVEELNNKWAPRIAEAEGQEEVQQLREQATNELTQAVENAGLSVEEYNQIYRAAQQDQQLASQIQQFRQNMTN